MKIIIDEGEMRELIINHIQAIIGDKAYKIIGDLPASLEIIVAPGSTIKTDTVGSAINEHVGSEVKTEPAVKRTRRSRPQMIADGDATATTPEEQASANEIIAARKQKDIPDLIEPESKIDPVKEKEEPGTLKNQDSLFDS